MKLIIAASIMFFATISCKSKKEKEIEKFVAETNRTVAESKRRVEEAMAKRYVDSVGDKMEREINKKVFFDTVGVSDAPVKIIKTRLYKGEYSNYKDISITFKNVSNKTIEGIRFSWYGETVFGDPADMGSLYSDGFGGGFTEKKIKPGLALTLNWDINSRNAKTAISWPVEVVFTDKSSWKSKSINE